MVSTAEQRPGVAELEYSSLQESVAIHEGAFLEELLKPSPEIKHPTIYEINTLPFLTEVARKYGRWHQLHELPEEVMRELRQHDSIWFMGVFERGDNDIARKYRHELTEAIPDVRDEQIVCSAYAIRSYNPHQLIVPSWKEWRMFRERLGKTRSGLDGVFNQSSLNSPDFLEHPEWYITAPREQADICNRDPLRPLQFSNVSYIDAQGVEHVGAHGRDVYPEMTPWIDTLAYNPAHPGYRAKVIRDLTFLVENDIADFFRLDMAQLLLTRKFLLNWGWRLSQEDQRTAKEHPFFPSVLGAVRQATEASGKTFKTYGEAYEWDDLRELAPDFDGLYFEPLYKDLQTAAKYGRSRELLDPVLRALIINSAVPTVNQDAEEIVYAENHDTARSARVFTKKGAVAASVITGLMPKIWLFHAGQEEGRIYHQPVQLLEFASPEHDRVDPTLRRYYDWIEGIRGTYLWQQGEHSLPYVDYSADGQYKTHNLNVVAHKAEIPGIGGAVVCTNFTGAHGSSARVHIPRHRAVYEYDLDKDSWRNLPPVDGSNGSGSVEVDMEPWGTKVYFYSL